MDLRELPAATGDATTETAPRFIGSAYDSVEAETRNPQTGLRASPGEGRYPRMFDVPCQSRSEHGYGREALKEGEVAS